MTHQLAEILERDEGAPPLPMLSLYGVYAGDKDHPGLRERYLCVVRPDLSKVTQCTALWRGHVSAYRLTVDGRLILTRLVYPFTEDAAPDEANETLQGDFWLDLREGFLHDGIRVQFRQGFIVKGA